MEPNRSRFAPRLRQRLEPPRHQRPSSRRPDLSWSFRSRTSFHRSFTARTSSSWAGNVAALRNASRDLPGPRSHRGRWNGRGVPRPEPAGRARAERVILFGSHALGSADADSDVDLLVVLPVEGSKREKQIEIRMALRDLRVATDMGAFGSPKTRAARPEPHGVAVSKGMAGRDSPGSPPRSPVPRGRRAGRWRSRRAARGNRRRECRGDSLGLGPARE